MPSKAIMGRRAASITRLHKQLFLAQFATHGTVTATAKALGLTRDAVYKWQRADPEFRTAFDEVRAQYRTHLLYKAEEQLEAKVEAGNLAAIRIALQAGDPETYGRRGATRHQHQGVLFHTNLPAPALLDALPARPPPVDIPYRIVTDEDDEAAAGARTVGDAGQACLSPRPR